MSPLKRTWGIKMERCNWCCDNGIVQKYHDEEWGIPLHDDKKHFEFLLMEVMQCGLNWTMMLKKRDIFRQCFADFNYKLISKFTESDIDRIMQTEGMIRSRRKIEAVIGNAGNFIRIVEEFGSFDNYIWSFSDFETIIYRKHQLGQGEASNALSDCISRDLRKRGMKYLGSITVFSHLQACGIINDHSPGCWMYDRLIKMASVKYVDD